MTRDNGLEAGSYTPLTALASGAADAVLEYLRQAGVAAYVVGVEHGTANRLVLWVDSGALARARTVLDDAAVDDRAVDDRAAGDAAGGVPAAADHTSSRSGSREGQPLDEDALWRSLVASFETPTTDPVPRWPDSENVDEPPEEADGPPSQSRVLRRIDPRPVQPHPPADTDADSESESGTGTGSDSGTGSGADSGSAADVDEHFVPPPPPPLPRPDPVTRWAWVGLLGGPVFLFIAALLGQRLADWLVLAALGAFVVGFVTLVARMKDRPPGDSGGDDGAVV